MTGSLWVGLTRSWYRDRQMLLRVPAIVLLVGLTQSVNAEPVQTVRDNGDPTNRIDLVLLGDGYTASEQGKFASDVERVLDGFFGQQPFKEYRQYFNVHRVNVVSIESGADHPRLGVQKNTRFDAEFDCYGIDRLLCVDMNKVDAVVDASITVATKKDFVMVLVNDQEYGGSGGRIAVASLHASTVELLLHEFGHSFGLLADEYDTEPPTCENNVEPPEPNVTMETNRAKIKWNKSGGPPKGWIDAVKPVPTDNSESGVGLFKGGRYCADNMYRPTYVSKMKELQAPFEKVNEEQLVKRVYNWVEPIDTAMPASSSMNVLNNTVESFQVGTPKPMTHAMEVKWYVDQAVRGQGPALQFDAGLLGPGTHTVQAVVKDATDKVRNDEEGLLTSTRSWNVTVAPEPAVPFAAMRAKVDVVRRSRPHGGFTVKGVLSLGPGSNGIRPRQESLGLALETQTGLVFSETLPAKRLSRTAPKTFKFTASPQRSGIAYVKIAALAAAGSYKFQIKGQRLSLYGLQNSPITVSLRVGDDTQQFVSSDCREDKRHLICQ